jgi:hypothetical protein
LMSSGAPNNLKLGLTPRMGQELIQVVLVGFAGMGRGGAEQPGTDRPADVLAEIAGHLAGKGRDGGRGNRPWGDSC